MTVPPYWSLPRAIRHRILQAMRVDAAVTAFQRFYSSPVIRNGW